MVACSAELPVVVYNVSHHGTVVAVASDTLALVGVGLTDRPSGQMSVGEFFWAFAVCFHPSEWKYNRSTKDEDRSVLSPWSLKETFIEEVGVYLGFSLL
ncbi:unnamed protein product [Phytophthora lilii]|uniref:Unnamed protein product n=1 Tax=Phytophthora lilii TaxID=2077276 RepID=A0A9W6WWH7_9STRA|nr:unnamed protein product [Phytophthora lilii]